MNNSPDTNTARDDDNAESSEDPGNFFFYCWSIYGRRIYGGFTLPLTKFLEFWLRFLGYEIFFCQCNQNYLRSLWLKFFIFQMRGRWFPWYPKGGAHPLWITRYLFRLDMIAIACNVMTLCGFEKFYVHTPTHSRSTKKVSRHIQHVWRIYNVIYVSFLRNLAALATASLKKNVEALDFHLEYVSW